MLLVFEFGLLSACLTMFLNYCIGKPGSEFSPYEIFSNYTFWLSKRRLKKIGLLDQYCEQLGDSLKRTKSTPEVLTLENDFKKMIYEAAEPFFKWERAAGMCPVCFGFWVSVLIGVIFTFNFSEIIGITVISHIAIRIFNKVL